MGDPVARLLGVDSGTGDVAWVLTTIVILATGTFSSAGTWIAVARGIGVADFAALQIWLRRRAFADGVGDAQPG